MASSGLPAFALFPIATWRDQVLPNEWVACLNAWLALIDSHLALSDADFLSISAKDDTLHAFLASFTREVAVGGANTLGPSSAAKRLLKDCLAVTAALLKSPSPPGGLAQWEFLADLSRVYGKKKAETVLGSLSPASKQQLDASLAGLKRFLIKNLDAGLNGGDLKGIEVQLERVNDLISISPSTAEFFLAGSDFVDGLISCYKITNPPLRKALIATTYLCLVGLANGHKTSALTDQLYSLKAAADAHKTGPLNVNDSLVAELVTSTPLLQRLQRKLEESGSASTRSKSVLAALGIFKKPGGGLSKPKRLIKRKIDKGKGLAAHDAATAQQELHIHRTTQISQVQDLFPDLGTAFISTLLDEYASDTEQIIAHLLDDSLPPHLQSADRTASLPPFPHPDPFPPLPTPPPHPLSEDDDDLALLTSANLNIGKNPHRTADTLLSAPTSTTQKAAILSALAAFDSDDDERDDTYDAADVGGTVDAATTVEDIPSLAAEAEGVLYRAWVASQAVFARDAVTRRGAARAALRAETGMTDEAIEGWGVMMGRDAGMKRRMEVKYGEWRGGQAEVAGTAWRAGEEEDDGGSGAEGGVANRGGYGRGGRGRGGRGGRSGAPPTGPAADSDVARRRKEANKGSRANHNRRDQRARKMARGGFAG
ncbi:hypothetical protein C8A05DRAFT_35536 [Staphylotrichum tortipilum]|uniref:CUE domain-containing protein n=1 Tax=Staphylotrichum tortipilum TaxID=2831512 RepID=A0AAN6MH88_9PEZI|nr:hypothetical protein C8A05DRAFT_35536 [Staphylotrichum longicolle]